MNLKFGTGGLRAVMGPGPDCLNLETVQEATLGLLKLYLSNVLCERDGILLS